MSFSIFKLICFDLLSQALETSDSVQFIPFRECLQRPLDSFNIMMVEHISKMKLLHSMVNKVPPDDSDVSICHSSITQNHNYVAFLSRLARSRFSGRSTRRVIAYLS